MGLVEHSNTAVPQSRGWLFSNNRFAESYDQLGACLGSGGMGRVWAARVAETASSSSGPGRPAGSWVAVKAIPMELAEDDFSSGNLQNGLRECLSTFRDLSPVHVVRYDSYWMEEQEHLPLEMRRFWEPGLDLAPPLPIPPLALAEEAPSEEAEGECPNSQRTVTSEVSPRFADDLPNGCLPLDGERYGGPRLERAASMTPATPIRYTSHASIFSDSCGFVFEASATPATSSMALPTPAVGSDVPLRRCEDRAAPRPPFEGWRLDAPAAPETTKGPTRVVLLIEMELMGAVPGRADKNDTEERLTLRAWLQRCGPPCRTFRHAADVFGMLMLSVRHIHRKRIVHADLKPDNIFLVADRLSKVIAVRIGDFGLAGENQQFRQFRQSDDPGTWILRKSLPAGGTPGYLAPELLSQESPCSDKADIFACAVILLEVLLPPFRTHMERTTFLDGFRIRNAVPEFLEVRLPKTRALLKDMGAEDPACRLSAEEVCKKFEKEVRKELSRLSIQRCSSPSVFLNVDPGRRRLDSGDQERDVDNKRQTAKGKRRGKQNGRRQRAKGGKAEEPD